MKNKLLLIAFENIKTVFYALCIAIFIRSLFFQPFYIPSSSMEPNLLIGDRIFVSKYSYGYSKHSFPFSPPLFKKRFFYKKPVLGDLVVFKTPADNRTDYIKRLIGMPGDTIQFINGEIFLNDKKLLKIKLENKINVRCGSSNNQYETFRETLPNGVTYTAVYKEKGSFQNSDKFTVPSEHYFLLGDNRDCSKDSRYLTGPGYVNYVNLVGKARLIFFSNDTLEGSILKIWNLNNSLRVNRFFKKI